MRKDPVPLHQIQAFEAAARNLSFTRAASELNVQQPAVSRQVAMLEQLLGATLFRRSKPRLTLTAEGEVLLEAVSAGFGAIASGMRQVKALREGEVIVVNAAIGFTSLFLLPRLAEFQTLHPDVRLEIVTRDQNPDFDPAKCDIVMTFGETGVPGTRSKLVFREELIAVCKAGYLGSDAPLERRDLARQRLLHLSSPDHADDWKRYFEGSDAAPPQPRPLDRILSYMVYLRAIQTGGGIGLGWCRLIEEMLDSGALEVACDHKVVTDRGYHCCVMPRAANHRGAMIFLDWIAEAD